MYFAIAFEKSEHLFRTGVRSGRVKMSGRVGSRPKRTSDFAQSAEFEIIHFQILQMSSWSKIKISISMKSFSSWFSIIFSTTWMRKKMWTFWEKKMEFQTAKFHAYFAEWNCRMQNAIAELNENANTLVFQSGLPYCDIIVFRKCIFFRIVLP